MLGIGLAEILFMLFPFGLVAFIIWLAMGRIRDKRSKQAEVQKEIIGKFSSSAEMQSFLKSEEGRALFKDFVTADRAPRTIRERAIARLGIGIVLIVVGAGLMVLAHYSDQPQRLISAIPQAGPPGNSPNGITPPAGPLLEMPPGTGLPAAALFLTGVGLVISSLVSMRLSSGGKSDSGS